MKLASILLYVAAIGNAVAQDCTSIPDDILRLNCYDKHSGFQPPPAPPPQPSISKTLKLADEMTPKGIGSDPASASLARKDGEEFSVIKAAVTWQPDFSLFDNTLLGKYGWGPYLTYALYRNTLVGKVADTRNLSTGFTGTILNIDKVGFAFFSKFGYTYREDDIEPSRTDVFVWDNTLVADWLRCGIPTEGNVACYVFPRAGLIYEDKRRAKAGTPTGERSGAFVNIKGELYPGLLTDRLKFGGTWQRFEDNSASDGLDRRGETYKKIFVEYIFYSPLDDPAVKPSMALERSTGADPLNGIPRAGLTQFTVRLKIN